MLNIHKLKLNPYTTKYFLPADAKIVKVAWQKGDVCIWYEFEHGSSYGNEERIIRVIPTGVAFEEDLDYVGSAVSDDLVFHVYSGIEI